MYNAPGYPGGAWPRFAHFQPPQQPKPQMKSGADLYAMINSGQALSFTPGSLLTTPSQPAAAPPPVNEGQPPAPAPNLYDLINSGQALTADRLRSVFHPEQAAQPSAPSHILDETRMAELMNLFQNGGFRL